MWPHIAKVQAAGGQVLHVLGRVGGPSSTVTPSSRFTRASHEQELLARVRIQLGAGLVQQQQARSDGQHRSQVSPAASARRKASRSALASTVRCRRSAPPPPRADAWPLAACRGSPGKTPARAHTVSHTICAAGSCMTNPMPFAEARASQLACALAASRTRVAPSTSTVPAHVPVGASSGLSERKSVVLTATRRAGHRAKLALFQCKRHAVEHAKSVMRLARRCGCVCIHACAHVAISNSHFRLTAQRSHLLSVHAPCCSHALAPPVSGPARTRIPTRPPRYQAGTKTRIPLRALLPQKPLPRL